VHEVLLDRVVAGLPPVEELVAEKARDLVLVRGERVEEEASLGELPSKISRNSRSSPPPLVSSLLTSAGAMVLCGHTSAWGFAFAVAPARLCTIWNEASRLSYVK
jgi:hypothetical protein